MTIPWQAYTDSGVPVDYLKSLEGKYESLLSGLSGAVAAFNRADCPAGRVFNLAFFTHFSLLQICVQRLDRRRA
jgi:hypothetical protein